MPATKNPFPKSIDVYISPTYNYSSIQVACHKAWLTTSCFQLKWFQFFHRKKPSTLAFNTSASSNSCGVKWGPSFDFSGHLEGMGMLFLTSHDWSGWQIDWKLENPATLISWNGKEIIFKEHSFFLLNMDVWCRGSKTWRGLSVATTSVESVARELCHTKQFHGCENETHEDFSQFLLAIHILIPDLYYKASSTFKHESYKKNINTWPLNLLKKPFGIHGEKPWRDAPVRLLTFFIGLTFQTLQQISKP